ncbi:MAG: kelch repeat-containing protein [Planctomycetota bacterium]
MRMIKFNFILTLVIFFAVTVQAVVWVSGSKVIDQTGVYGIKGESDPCNLPGARSDSISWTDSQDKLWLFGGSGYDESWYGYLNDLWRYDPNNGMWTWMSGSKVRDQKGVYGIKGESDPCNLPGARYGSISWTDSQENLWLFGGAGKDETSGGWLNDLWRYDPNNGMWTWMSGSKVAGQNGVYGTKGEPNLTNVPGARNESISWTDSEENLWFFGGFGKDEGSFDNGYLNDLWIFDPNNGMWTWVSGSKLSDQTGVYGIKGESDPCNLPGAREGSISWTDSEENLWLFGGYGFAESSFGYLNDLWRYDTNNGMWTWVSGSKLSDQTGVYGIKGETDPCTVPSGRAWSISWTDSEDNLWFFGGFGLDESSFGYLNDLWRYDRNNGMWTWMSGSKVRDQTGVYGIKGEPYSTNLPGGRYSSISWTDSNYNLWFFGGSGFDESSSGSLNDLWRFECEGPPGDVSGDCLVNFLDFAIMAQHWLEKGTIVP